MSAVLFIILFIVQWRSVGRKKIVARAGIAAILMIYVLLIGLIFLIASLMSDDSYIPAILLATFCFFVLIPLTIFKVFWLRRLLIIWASAVGLILLTIAGITAYNKYDDSFELVTTYLSPHDFIPYREGSRVARLDSPSELYIESDTVSMDGATALYPVYAAFAQAIYPEDFLPPTNSLYDPDESMVACTSTPNAYERLIQGDVDMIFIAEPSEDQRQAAVAQGIELEFIPIGKEAFVFFVNTDNSIDGLSQAQVREIYSGEITNWRDLGGYNKKIQAFQRDEGSGSQSAFQRFMAGVEVIPPISRRVVSEMGPMIDYAADYKNYPGAIGYSFRYYTQVMANNSRIKLLALDDVYPSVENIRNGNYPRTSYFYAVIDKNNPNPNIRPLLAWILSAQGQELIEKTGYSSLGE